LIERSVSSTFLQQIPQRGNDVTPLVDFRRAFETGRFDPVR
jgi:hypothetical protein